MVARLCVNVKQRNFVNLSCKIYPSAYIKGLIIPCLLYKIIIWVKTHFATKLSQQIASSIVLFLLLFVWREQKCPTLNLCEPKLLLSHCNCDANFFSLSNCLNLVQVLERARGECEQCETKKVETNSNPFPFLWGWEYKLCMCSQILKYSLLELWP